MEGKFKILTSSGCQNNIPGLCCDNRAEKQNIYFSLLSNICFRVLLLHEVKKFISLLFLDVCFGFFGLICIIESKCMRSAKIINLSFGFW